MSKQILFALYFMICLGAVSCSRIDNPIIQPTATVTLETATPTQVPESNASTAPSTQTPTQVQPTQTATPTVSTTPTQAIPTLSAAERQIKIEDLLQTNGGCDLPCWWGFTPGQSKWADMEAFFRQLGVIHIGNVSVNQDSFFHGIGEMSFEDPRILHRFGFLEREGELIAILLDIEGYKEPQAFQSVWQRYSPQQIMEKYGQPDRIWIETRSVSLGDRHGYDFWVVYEQVGMIIQYSGFLEERGETLRLCPAFQDGEDIMYMRVYIQSTDVNLPIEEYGGLASLDVIRQSRSIEDATGISEAQYYQMTIDNANPACLDTPAKFWESSP